MTRRMLALAALVASSGAWIVVQQRSPTVTAQDFVDIQDLYARYNWALDSGDAEGWAATFTPDGVFRIVDQGEAGNNVGHDAIVKFAKGFSAGLGAHVKHWNTNLMITPTTQGASGRVYLVLVDFGARPASIVTSAAYTDELARTAQGWRFRSRAVKGDVAPPAKPQ